MREISEFIVMTDVWSTGVWYYLIDLSWKLFRQLIGGGLYYILPRGNTKTTKSVQKLSDRKKKKFKTRSLLFIISQD